MRCTPRLNRQRGFTLIEAMSAGVVLSILSLGLMGVWSVAGANVQSLVIREKAIWTLNGQMERLAALYTYTDFAAFGMADSTGYGYGAAFSDTRKVYGASADTAMADENLAPAARDIAGQANGFVQELAADFDTAEGHPVVLTDSLTVARRNYVWIDRDRDIVGRLSWEESDLVIDACDANNAPSGANPCLCFDFDKGAGGARCREIMLSLEFPIRWDRAADQAVALPGQTEVLSLRTIVGRRL